MMAIIYHTPVGPVVYDCPFVPARRPAPWGWGQGLDVIDRVERAATEADAEESGRHNSCGDATNEPGVVSLPLVGASS